MKPPSIANPYNLQSYPPLKLNLCLFLYLVCVVSVLSNVLCREFPSQLCKEDRLQYISNIVTVAAMPMSSVSNTQDVIESFIPHSDKVAYFHQGGEAICDLRNTSYTFGSAHTCILLSPTCILLHK